MFELWIFRSGAWCYYSEANDVATLRKLARAEMWSYEIIGARERALVEER